MTAVSLQLYGNSYCHLCEEMLQALNVWRQRFGFSLEVVDIEGNSVLEQRFGERIPVLVLEGEEICHYFLDEEALKHALERVISRSREDH